MAEALAPVVDLDASEDFEASAFGVSDFIVSPEEAAGGVALGLELGLDGDEYCAKADESINPLSAVVINNFLSIEKPPCMWCQVRDGVRHGFLFAVWKKNRPSTHQRLMSAAVPRWIPSAARSAGAPLCPGGDKCHLVKIRPEARPRGVGPQPKVAATVP